MSKFTSKVRVNTKALTTLAAVKFDQTVQDVRTAKKVTEQELLFQDSMSEQEKRDRAVIKAAAKVEEIDAEFLALDERYERALEALNAKRARAIANLESAKAHAEDPTDLPIMKAKEQPKAVVEVESQQ